MITADKEYKIFSFKTNEIDDPNELNEINDPNDLNEID
jgi:hypothetical protein